MEDAGHHQANLVKYIIAHMSGLHFTYQPQELAYAPTPNTDPTIVPTIQPTSLANVTTDISDPPPPFPPDTDQHATDAATSDYDAD